MQTGPGVYTSAPSRRAHNPTGRLKHPNPSRTKPNRTKHSTNRNRQNKTQQAPEVRTHFSRSFRITLGTFFSLRKVQDDKYKQPQTTTKPNTQTPQQNTTAYLFTHVQLELLSRGLVELQTAHGELVRLERHDKCTHREKMTTSSQRIKMNLKFFSH